MKNIRRFAVILLTICAVLVCASCKKCSDDKKNIVVPAISNPDGTFLKIGDFVVTNKEAYHQLLNSYGIEVLLNEIDDALLPAVSDENAFKEYLDEIIYGDEEKTDEALQEFLDKLSLSGLTKENYEAYYRLNYRRLEAAKKLFLSELEDDYYTEDDLEAAFETLYRKNNDLIIIEFDSRKEANAYLTQNNIDLNYLNNGWRTTDGKELSDAEILAVFENIAKTVYGDNGSSYVQTYTYEDLTTINSKLASSVYKWKAQQYSKAPTMYGSELFLVYKNAETGHLNEGVEVTFDQVKDEVKDYLIETEVTSTYATKVSLENQVKNGLKIYDESLENFYELTFDNVYSNLGIKEYDEFPAIDENSESNVFEYTVNGKTVTVTADDMFAKLKESYGTYLAALYIKQYIVLKDNGVYNIVTGEILDQEQYDKYYKAEITEYKEAFEDGDYASLGYDANYGWENFIRDYLGILSEEKILINLDSSLYTDSYNKLKDVLTLQDEVKDAEGNVTATVDQLIQDKMEEIYKDYLNATAIGVKSYFDKDLDNKADELEEGSTEAIVAKNLLAEVYAQAEKLDGAISSVLNSVILEYQLATIGHPVWGQYKKAGVKLVLVASGSYTASSKNDEIILDHLRSEYAEILDFAKADEGTDLSGQDLSDGYTYSYTPKAEDGVTPENVTTTIDAFKFVDVESAENDIIEAENVQYLFFVTKVTKPYYINTSSQTYKPSRTQYETYLKDASDLTTAVKNCITTYYIPAINAIASDTELSNYLMNEALELLSGITYEDVSGLETYIKACIVDTNEGAE